jgi:hypothetical protein
MRFIGSEFVDHLVVDIVKLELGDLAPEAPVLRWTFAIVVIEIPRPACWFSTIPEPLHRHRADRHGLAGQPTPQSWRISIVTSEHFLSELLHEMTDRRKHKMMPLAVSPLRRALRVVLGYQHPTVAAPVP